MIRPVTLIAVVLMTQVVGCASIVNGQNQSLSVETRTEAGAVAGATCTLSNNKGTWYVTTPGSTTVHRSYEALAVRCEKEALEPGLASVKSSTKAMAFGNILFGGIIGAGVDMSTGAAYDYPALISVIMGKSASVGTPADAKADASKATGTPPVAAATPTR
ncbi:MAG: hypothetical protein ACXWJM_06260 [Ramlibacter sp.]